MEFHPNDSPAQNNDNWFMVLVGNQIIGFDYNGYLSDDITPHVLFRYMNIEDWLRRREKHTLC